MPQREEIDAVVAQLGPDGRSAMLDDLIEAVWSSRAHEGLESLLSVVKAWVVDTKVVNRPGFEERLRQTEGQTVTQADLLGRINSA
jgi:hypothetical protein